MELADCSPEEVILCPSCLVPVQMDRVCPVCGARLDKGDWPAIPQGDGLSPWSAKNLLPPEGGGSRYRLSPLSATVEDGELRTRFPYEFASGKRVVRIGGSSLLTDVLIAGASPLHAALLLNGRTKTWWAYDCGSASGTFVNGERIHFKELQGDDVLTVAGVRLVFRGDRLETGRASAEGMALSVENLCFSIEGENGVSRQILDHVTFSVSPGEFIGILGPSGCGKSSLVQRLVGLASPDSGEIYVNGRLRDSDPDGFRAATAYLPQNVEKTLHDALTLDEEIDCFRRINLPRSENELQENRDCLGTLGLSGKSRYRVGSLSGGEKRRVGIALALLRRPQLLLLDEPGAGLDPASEGVLMRHLRGIADQGRTILCVTHVLANAEKFDKLLVLSKGKVVYFGKPSELLSTFGEKDLGALYQQLESGVSPRLGAASVANRTLAGFPPVVMPSLLRRTLGYVRRTAREFFAVRRGRARTGFAGVGARLRAALFSVPGVLLLWQPLGLVIGIRLACACYFRTNGGKPIDIELLGFCAALAMFWIGINNTARVLVNERVPGRCLENLNQVPLPAYLLSRLVWTAVVCVTQTLSFAVLLWLAARIPVQLATSVDSPTLSISLSWAGPLSVSCLMGASCGLAVSAIAKKTMSAVSMVPNIAILALLFSNAMVRFNDRNDYYAPIAKTLATTVMPCYWPSKVLADMQSGVADGGATARMLSLLAIYVACSLVVVWVFQRKNEKAWDGR